MVKFLLIVFEVIELLILGTFDAMIRALKSAKNISLVRLWKVPLTWKQTEMIMKTSFGNRDITTLSIEALPLSSNPFGFWCSEEQNREDGIESQQRV